LHHLFKSGKVRFALVSSRFERIESHVEGEKGRMLKKKRRGRPGFLEEKPRVGMGKESGSPPTPILK
jgi:hypothetical protein